MTRPFLSTEKECAYFSYFQFFSLLFKEKSQFLQLPLLSQSSGAVPVGRLGVMTMGEEATVNRCLVGKYLVK